MISPNGNLSTNIGFDEFGTYTTDSSIQRSADLLFHNTYYTPYEYG